MTRLNTKYFKTVGTKKHGEFEYTIYKPLDNPMILYSKKDGTALASLHLRCQNNNYQNDKKSNRGRALITKRPKQSSFNCDFQGLIDRNGQEFELVITNLTNKGYINFNILKKNRNIKEVNPGGLNQVNELGPFDSYAVQCDQATNCTLVLNAIKKSTSSGTVNVTVGEDESHKSKPTGTYYYLSVVPEIGKKDLIELYKETVWACSDVFVIRNKIIRKRYRRTTGASFRNVSYDRLDSDGYVPRSLGTSHSTGEQGSIDISFNILGNSDVRSMRGMGSRGEINLSDLYDNMEPRRGGLVDPRMAMTDKRRSKGAKFIPDPHGYMKPGGRWIDPRLDTTNNNTSHDLDGFFDTDLTEDCTRQCMFLSEDMLQTKGLGMDTFKNSNQRKPVSHDIIRDSLASSVLSGRKITVTSSKTNIEYNYDTPSVSCVIGLSISPGLVFHPDATDLLKCGEAMVDDLISNESKKLLAELTAIYEEKNCVICLEGKEDGSPVNSVFYQCGHKCCHDRCGSKLDKCPLCRKYISAHIKV
uniref:RNA polymerase Rpb1, domain 1 n=1 Tax=Mimivirus LCMiAC01 TaxID=2506608 RepID=A0A481Z059_9VIRU|nr:MAG: RNA polymerase Rpb1, domain 1 [Mimivirus LCMiAC01]